MKPVLRPYQQAAADAVTSAWAMGVRRPALVLATGTGKTVILSSLVSRMIRSDRSRPLILVHREELVAQTVAKLGSVDSDLAVGVIQAERHEVDADVVVASVQSLVRRLGTGKRSVALNRFNVIVVDEGHHASAPSYMSILTHFGAFKSDSGTVSLGVTATLARSDGVPLGHVWDEVVFEYGAAAAIHDGFLVKPRAERIVLPDLDLSSVKIVAKDYSDGALGSQMVRSGGRIAESILEHARDAEGGIRRGIVFAPTVECAWLWCEDFRAAGIRSDVVTGTTPTDVRRRIYADTAAHRNDMIVSVMCLTEGFDLPSVEVAVVGRPTKSVPLYTQMVGRVLRPSPLTGKVDALVLDVGGKIREKLTTLVDLRLPNECGCECSCPWIYGCPMHCDCPRSISGKLKKPCVICHALRRALPPGELLGPCSHYDRLGTKHLWDCVHTCEGVGRPGIYVEDDVEEEIELEGATELEIDHSEIVTESVDLFEIGRSAPPDIVATPLSDAALIPGPHPPALPTRRFATEGRSRWLLSNSGRPFLPSTSNFEFTIFLWIESDGSWSVGKKARGKRAERMESGIPFDNARRVALAMHPGMAPKLYGSATPKQIDLLARFNVDGSAMTKQEASDALSIALASEWL